MRQRRVIVLRGGPSDEHDVSMRSGANILRSLRQKNDQVKDIVISRKGEWLDAGLVKSPDQILHNSDLVFIALHGGFGEDGEVQKLIKRYNLPFTGSGSLASAIAFNKHVTKEALKDTGISLPAHRIINTGNDLDVENEARFIKAEFGPEYVIKPVASGSSVGVSVVKLGQSLEEALASLARDGQVYMVEEYIRGKEATCAVLEDFRNERHYGFPPIEIIPPSDYDFFSFEAKYNGKTKEICPGNFSFSESRALIENAINIHKALHLTQYSRSDFMVKNGKVYFLEVNTLPGLTDESLFPKAAEAVGLTYDDLIDHLLETALP